MISKKTIWIVFTFVLFTGMFPSFVLADGISAPDFTTIDEDGVEFSLSDYAGEVVVLHITGLETPLCIECLEEMTGQLEELEQLSDSTDLNILTINLRKNPNSDSGKVIAERDYNINVSWRWVEDFSPYPVAGLYQEYWTVQGAFSNPTIILIDQNQSIVGLYHVYLLGKGKIDDIQSAESLKEDVQSIRDGAWETDLTEEKFSDSITFLGIFGLGILTALSPCSIALLVAMISYVGSLQKDNEKKDKKLKKISVQGLWIGIVFTLGMALVFFVFGLVISSVSIFIEASALFYLISGIILVVLGINVFTPLKEFIKKDSNSEKNTGMTERGQKLFFKLSKRSMYVGAFFLGVLFSIGWAPCAISLMMPVFILMLSQQIPLLIGGLMLFVFGLGHGIPIIPLCAVTSSVRGKLGNKYVTAGKWMQRIFGLIIIAIGILMAIRFWGINFW
ncbi:MAG: cytochrome c biogenesis protein [Candidatus Thermoplasmatota archaeon]|nr:cytochrome c biogenesis protein [Candidatus Thermoplasmatota archaeon]